jgi:hypothetical protein
MPELSCENPSQEELQSYLNEHWQETEKTINYFFDHFGVDTHESYTKYHDVILHSLYRLNDIPRDNKFWHNTNNKPTIYKLNEFCRLKLAENADDVLFLWTIIALAIKYGHIEEDFSKNLRKLAALGELKTNILIEMYLTEDIIYDGNGEALAEWLNEFRWQNEAKQMLNGFIKSENDFVSSWAKVVLSRIENK